MKLNISQIEQLYAFTKAHYVEHYDLQTELVDHLANGIEEIIEANPKTTFEDALKTEFKKFGIMGFGDVVEEKTKALNKHYRLLVWKHLKTFFGLPKIVISLALMYLVYMLLLTIENKVLVTISMVLVLIILHFYYFFYQTRKIKKRFKETNRKWLFENTILQFGGLIHFINIGCYAPIFSEQTQWSNFALAVFSVTLVVYFLMLYIAAFVVAPKIRLDISSQYPEYSL